MSNICKQDTDKVLLVEGDNDCHVVMALCNAHQVPETFGIYQCGSDVQVLKRLNALISRPDPPKIIGVMLDADQSPANRWQSIQDKLKHYSYLFPAVPNTEGTVIESVENLSKLGFWLMPNNLDSGMLEDFCAQLAEPQSLAFAEECVKQALERNLTTFNQKVHFRKAVIHTYLAWHDEPGYPLGKAITSQALRPHTDLAIKFVDWLRHLFT